jgi:hypothetical protein
VYTGTVPIYLGDAEHLRALLPHPKAAIFIADYNGDYKKLANYLNYLSNNETAYEEHREWRKDFTYEKNIKNKILLQDSWYCNVCKWGAKNSNLQTNKNKILRKCSSHLINQKNYNNSNLINIKYENQISKNFEKNDSNLTRNKTKGGGRNKKFQRPIALNSAV